MNKKRQIFVSALVVAAASIACDRTPVRPTPFASAAVSTEMLGAKGGGKAPAEQPAHAVFRCNDASCAATDRIRGDGGVYASWIDSGGNFRLTLSDAIRSVTFDYSDCLPPCPVGRRWFTTISPTGNNGLLVHTSVLVPGSENETPGGLRDIPVGQTWFSRIKMGFSLTEPATGANLIWGTRFNPFFPGSTNLTVTRVADNGWHIEATTDHIAGVRSSGASKRDGPEVFEGHYLMPFRITVTAQ